MNPVVIGDELGGGEVFTYERAVRFDEVDAAGILFFARFFNYCHEALEALMAELPGGYVALINERRIGLPAVHLESDFRSPLRFGDVVRVDLSISKVGQSSCAIAYAMTRKDNGAPVARIEHVCATVSLETMTSIPVPPDMSALLRRFRPRTPTVT